jgi:micrococcal nuclease
MVWSTSESRGWGAMKRWPSLDPMKAIGLAVVMAVVGAQVTGSAEEKLRHATAIDGDTIRVLGSRQSVRILGLDAPELHGKCPAEIEKARRAKARMQALIDGGITLEFEGRRIDKYGRLLARVIDETGRDVANVMISEGLARPYDGGRRDGWCSPSDRVGVVE